MEGRCDGLKRTDFEQFLLWEGVVSIERTDFEQFLLWDRCEDRCGHERTDFEQFSSLLGQFLLWEGGGLERTYFEQFLLWDSVVVLKELILDSFYFGRVLR